MERSTPPTTQVGVLDRVMLILAAFGEADENLLPAQLAARTRLPVSTVYRLAHALCAHGLLEQDGNRFRLGLQLMRLGALVAEGLDVRRQALPAMRQLNEASGEHVELQVRRGPTRVAIETLHSVHHVRPYSEIGAPMPLHVGAAGKVLLAWLPPEQRRILREQSVARFPEHQPQDTRTFDNELSVAAARGWARSDGERAPGLAAIAAPVMNRDGAVVAALILAAVSMRLTPERAHELLPAVVGAAAAASTRLGYTGAGPVSFPAVPPATHVANE